MGRSKTTKLLLLDSLLQERSERSLSTKYVIALIESYLGESPGPRDVMGRANEYMGKRGEGGSE